MYTLLNFCILKHREISFGKLLVFLNCTGIYLIFELTKEQEETFTKEYAERNSGICSGKPNLLLLGCWENTCHACALLLPFYVCTVERSYYSIDFSAMVPILNIYSAYKSFKCQRNANTSIF